MSTIRMLAKPAILIAATSLCLATLLLTPARVESIGWGEGQWFTSTPLARDYDEFCTQSDPDADCGEWCEFNSTSGSYEASGTLCCLNPDNSCSPSNIFTG